VASICLCTALWASLVSRYCPFLVLHCQCTVSATKFWSQSHPSKATSQALKPGMPEQPTKPCEDPGSSKLGYTVQQSTCTVYGPHLYQRQRVVYYCVQHCIEQVAGVLAVCQEAAEALQKPRQSWHRSVPGFKQRGTVHAQTQLCLQCTVQPWQRVHVPCFLRCSAMSSGCTVWPSCDPLPQKKLSPLPHLQLAHEPACNGVVAHRLKHGDQGAVSAASKQ
jgi:hypothetical protein